eukprot:GHRQ01032246.1.p2 GENE.GHRQ01032246.1~~GHRQ01032246.1.p2  ORF type:complete len:105 (-),score=28.28 GHRQ01032246.1:175-489(-)
MTHRTACMRVNSSGLQAQERGELVQLQDDARYAMDGLAAACSLDMQRESAVTLADMLCLRRGRMALRCACMYEHVWVLCCSLSYRPCMRFLHKLYYIGMCTAIA